MCLALQQAALAAEHGEVPVGALLLHEGVSYPAHNAPISQHDTTAHAEIRAIRAASLAANNYRLPGATLYVTLEPCCMCAGAIIHARIARLVYAADDPKTGAAHSLYHLLSDPRLNHQVEICRGVMADESAQLLRDFFSQRRAARQSSPAACASLPKI